MLLNFSTASVICISSLLSSIALAYGPGSSGGGDGVVCQGALGSRSILSLDYLEALHGPTDGHPDLGAGNLEASEKVRLAIARVKEKSPEMAARLLQYAEHFEQNVVFVGSELPDVNDTEIYGLPENCWLKQLALQTTKTFFDEPRYYVNRNLYEKLDNTNKAFLELHEITYRLALRLGAVTSRKVRAFVGYISSKMISQASQEQFNEIVSSQSLSLKFLDYWEDKGSQRTWAYDEKGYTPNLDCGAIWGKGFHMASLAEIQDSLTTLRASPLRYFIFANEQLEVNIVSSTPAGYTQACSGTAPNNSVWALKARTTGEPELFRNCYDTNGPSGMCVKP
ncbi:MAG: hypothetical protein NTV34_12165 [Proteobacteria bacterium]|nr:hypothetical protein [Pseudomonadota bacterium]